MTPPPKAVGRAPLLAIEGLTVPLPGGARRDALSKVDLALQVGEILCVVGESGSGKSMCANAVMGLLPEPLKISAGRICFDGRDLLTLAEPDFRRLRGAAIGMIFQEPLSALNPVMRVGAQIREVFRVHGHRDAAEVERRTHQQLERVGLPDPATLAHAYPFQLSGGQRQRVMIAMALALEPKILIADEPTTALDVTTQAQILQLIRSLQRSTGMGVLLITHDFGVVAEIADRVAVMEHGVVVETGTVDRVLNAPKHAYTRRLIAAVPRRRDEAHAVAPSHAGTPSAPVLEVQGLQKHYVTRRGWRTPRRVVHAVDGVDFQVARGETLGIVGESGSGKSTIGKCLLKLIAIDGGRILFEGRDIAPLSAHAFRPLRRQIQMVFQDPYASLNPRQTVGRIVSDGPVASGATRAQAEARARELIALVGLDDGAFDRYPNQFSGGQRQRVGIARALALDPKVLVADEAVSALDVSVQAQVLALLRELQQRLRLALVFITHDLRVAAQICDTVLVMHRGRVVERGSPRQIFEDPRHAYTQALIAAVPGQAWNPTRAVTGQAAAAATMTTPGSDALPLRV